MSREEKRGGEGEVNGREMSQFYKAYTGTVSMCACVRAHVGVCVYVAVGLKSYFHIGPLTTAITQPYFPSVYNFFQSARFKMPNFNKVRKAQTQGQKKKQVWQEKSPQL